MNSKKRIAPNGFFHSILSYSTDVVQKSLLLYQIQLTLELNFQKSLVNCLFSNPSDPLTAIDKF